MNKPTSARDKKLSAFERMTYRGDLVVSKKPDEKEANAAFKKFGADLWGENVFHGMAAMNKPPEEFVLVARAFFAGFMFSRLESELNTEPGEGSK